MLARGYIIDNGQCPNAEFQQIVGGMRRLKLGCDELATASAVNNMPSMQGIDEAVLQMVKDCGKKLAHTFKTTNKVAPGPGAPSVQANVNPVLLRLNAPAPWQWSSATAVPNCGPVVQNAQRVAQNAPAAPPNPQAQNNPPRWAIPQAQLISDPPVQIPGHLPQALSVFIPGMPVQAIHPPAIPEAQNNYCPAHLQR